jgi:hypothetical protein
MKYCCRIILHFLLPHRGGDVVLGDSELTGGNVVKAFACIAQNWRNCVIQSDYGVEQ